MDIVGSIRAELYKMQDTKYRDFNSKLIPNVDKDCFIGVRTPELKSFAKELAKRQDISVFLNDLPHKYFEENNLHAFIISQIKDVDEAIFQTEKFLPYIDNWATCDQCRIKAFEKKGNVLREKFYEWVHSDKVYTIRFGIGMLMSHCLGENFLASDIDELIKVHETDYYVKMMIAWYLATALAKNYGEVLPYIEKRAFDCWTHNKGIQKAIESRRITEEQKKYLKSLKV